MIGGENPILGFYAMQFYAEGAISHEEEHSPSTD